MTIIKRNHIYALSGFMLLMMTIILTSIKCLGDGIEERICVITGRSVLETAEKHAPFEAYIQFEEGYEHITKRMSYEWRGINDDGEYVWDIRKIEDYFKELKEKYYIYGSGEVFIDHSGGIHEYDKKDSRWEINISESARYLIHEIDNNEFIVDPVWTNDMAQLTNTRIGPDYIEVDIKNQKVYITRDGKNVYTSDCVTGFEGISDTDKGIYSIAYMAKDQVLRGTNRDGTKYESPVKYWMPFNLSNGEGLHDASWRDTFGGSIYRTNGSHGCVNLPTETARLIYEKYGFEGMPVIVY